MGRHKNWPVGSLLGQRRDGAALGLLVLMTFAVHAVSPVTTSTDSAWTWHVSASILREGNIELDEYRSLMDLQLDYRLRVIQDHVYSYYPAATPLLTAPILLAANSSFASTRNMDFYQYLATHAPDERTARLEKLAASLIVGLATGLVYLAARRFTATPASAAVALIFAFGTSMWSTASRALWQHGPSVLVLLAALCVCLVKPATKRSAGAVGFLLAGAYLIRPTNSLSFIFIGAYYLLHQRRLAWAYLLGGALVLVPYVGSNLVTYGNILPPYSYQLFERIGSSASIGEALAGNLVSPNRGIFIFTPVFLFAVLGIRVAMTRWEPEERNLALSAVGIVVSHWVMTSFFEDWGGAWSIGPRYFVEIIPYLMFLILPVIASWPEQRSWVKGLFVVAALAGVFIQFRCATSPYPFMWNGKPQALVDAPARIWDWGDLQFLRGLCRDDPLEGGAPACWLETHD